MTHATNAALQEAFQQLAQWNAQGLTSQQEMQNLMALIGKLNGSISDLNGLQQQLNTLLQQYGGTLTTLNQKLADLINNKGSQADIDAVKAQIATVNGQISGVQTQISNNKATLASDQDTLAADKDTLVVVGKAVNNHESTVDMMKDMQTMMSAINSNAANDDPSQNTPKTPAEQQQQIQQAVQNFTQQAAVLQSAIQATIQDLAANKVKYNQDQGKIDEDQDKLKELYVALGVACAAAAASLGFDFAADAAIGVISAEIVDTKNDISNLQDDQAQCVTNENNDRNTLKTDLNKLKALDIAQIKTIIDSVKDLANKIAGLLGGSSESAMQAAAAAVVEVMQYLSGMEAQVHSKKVEDQQYMSEGSATMNQVAVSKAAMDATKFQADSKWASFLHVVMIVAQVVLAVAALAFAIVTGGAGAILLAAVMAACTAISIATNGKIDPMGMLTEQVAKGLQDLMGSSEDGFSKVLADILVAVAMAVVIVATDGAGAAAVGEDVAEDATQIGGEVLSSAAKTTAQQLATNGAEEIEMVEIRSVGEALEGAVASEASGAASTVTVELAETTEEAGTEEVQQVARNTTKDQAVSNASKVGNVLAKTAKMSAMTLMMNNGLVDSMMMFAQIATKKSEKDLDKDSTIQILKIVFGILQAIAMALAARSAFSQGSNEAEAGSFIKKLLDKVGVDATNILRNAQQASMGLTLVGNLLQAGSSGGTAAINNDEAKIVKDMGQQQSIQFVEQFIMKAIQQFEQTSSQQFAVFMQQQMQSISVTQQKMGQAEQEAARVMLETAV